MLQLISHALVTASACAAVAVAFCLVYGVARFFHFAHAVVFTSGPYFALTLTSAGLPMVPAILVAVALSTLLGCLMEVSTYRPLRHKGASSLILLLASLGIYIVLQNVISLVFGDDTKTIRSGVVREGIDVLGARITPIQITTICVSVVLVVALALFLRRTKLGAAMRAVSSNPELARVSGIDSDRVILWAFAIGSALAGIAGILVALDVDMTPTMGMHALMMGVVAVIIGGVNSIPGVALGALLLGLAQHLGVWKISSQWQDAIAFIILLAFLLFRPQGFLGRRAKKATV